MSIQNEILGKTGGKETKGLRDEEIKRPKDQGT
jgi:hypothetical protein